MIIKLFFFNFVKNEKEKHVIYYVHVIYKTDLIVLQKKHFIIYKKKFKGLSNLENSFKKLKNHFYYFLKKAYER